MKKCKMYLFLFMMYVLASPVIVNASLNYVGCGTAEGIPQPLVQMTRMLYTFLVVITPIILIATSIFTMVKALKEQNAEDINKAKNKLVKKFIAATIILLIGIIARFVLLQVATDKGDKSSIVSCMKCFLYNADCHESDSGNGVKRGYYYIEPDSEFVNDTEQNRSNYKASVSNKRSNSNSNNQQGTYSDIDYINRAMQIAADDSIGYGHLYPYDDGAGHKDISCSGLVGMSITESHFKSISNPNSEVSFLTGAQPPSWPYVGISDLFRSKLSDAGFVKMSVNSALPLKAGDVCIMDNPYDHTYFIVGPADSGNGYKVVDAMSNRDGTGGDSSGTEVSVHDGGGSDGTGVPNLEVWRLPDSIMEQHATKSNQTSTTTTVSQTSTRTGKWIAHQKNSRDRVQAAISAGFAGVEVDVHQEGNTFKLYHDTYHGYNLDEFLDDCKQAGILAVLDIKYVSSYGALINAIKSKGMFSNTVIQVGSSSAVNAIYDVDHSARIWFLNSANDTPLRTSEITAVKNKIELVNMLALSVNQTIVNTVHGMGLKIGAFSYINGMYPSSGRSAETLKSWGVDYLMANSIGN